MNRRVEWRTHLPALALIVVMLGIAVAGSPWPEPAADGFDAQGRPIHWKGGPFDAVFAASTFWLVLFALDGVWDLVERGRKRFNPLSLVDESLIAWMLVRVADAGVAQGMSPALRAAAWASAGMALVAAFALELSRGVVVEPPPGTPAGEDMASVVSGLPTLNASGQRWSYWSVQTPPHRWLFTSLGASFMIGAAAIPDLSLVLRLPLLAAGLLVLTVFSGGLRTVVTPRQLVLRAGYFGLPLLRIPAAEIAEVGVPDFDPMRDFGGWGIRRGFYGDFAGVWAFNLAHSGVLVRTTKGKRYLIGTDRPERLAAVLNAARPV